MSKKVRRARAGVLSGLGAFATLTIGLNGALETVGSRWRDPEYGHRIKELKPIAKDTTRPLIVAMGSSRSQMGFNPNDMGLDPDSGPILYNLSQAGCGPPQQYMNLARLLRDGLKPRVILVEILPPVMANRGPIEQSFQVEKLSYQDLSAVSRYFSRPDALTYQWLETRAVPWHSYRLNLISHVSPNWVRWQSRKDFLWSQMAGRGWMPYFHTTVTDEKRTDGLQQAAAQYQPYFVNFQISEMPRRAHRSFMLLAKQHGITVAFYTMPESITFRSWYPADVQSRLQEYYRELETEEQVKVFRSESWLDREEDFADGHHLMRSGASQFSRRFGHDCLLPWLADLGLTQRP